MKLLMVDIGAGTMDILYYDTASGLHYKAVAKSPVLSLAEKAAALSGDLLVVGTEMGGGPMARVLKEKAKRAEVVMSASAAATIHHDPERVRALGVRIMDDEEAEGLREDRRYAVLVIGDLEMERLRTLVEEGMGVPFSFDVVGICAQDHGIPPKGVSHLEYRHSLFKARLDQNPLPHALLYRYGEVPLTLNRLRSIAGSARGLPTDDVYVMDSGMAAILGAQMDYHVSPKGKVMVLDVATSHTLGAAIEGGEIAGFFEYHTHDITLKRVESLLHDLAEGKLDHEQILKEGGHGAYVRRAIGFQAGELIVATGPRRRLMEDSTLPLVFGAPLGDNMLTGTVGVLEAIRRHKGLKPISYL